VLPHPLAAALLTEAAEGRFPPADGGWRRVHPWRPGLEVVVAFTGHAVLAVADDRTDERLDALGVDGLGGASDPRVVAALAGPDGGRRPRHRRRWAGEELSCPHRSRARGGTLQEGR
jgi:hypothetical protein